MVVFYIPVECPWCGFRHKRYVNQTMPLYMDFWHVLNLNRCPPKHGGCGKNILVMAKPVRAYIEQKLDNSPDIDVKEFIAQSEHYFIRASDNLARFNLEGTIVAVQFDVRIEKYEGTSDEWYGKDKKLKEREVNRYGYNPNNSVRT